MGSGWLEVLVQKESLIEKLIEVVIGLTRSVTDDFDSGVPLVQFVSVSGILTDWYDCLSVVRVRGELLFSAAASHE